MKSIFDSKARVFAVAVAALTAASLVACMMSPLSRKIRKQEPVLGLLIGTDWVDNARHADTMVLVRYSPATRSLDLLSIPRDTRIEVPGLRIRRMNEVYAYAFRSNNRNHDAAIRELSRIIRSALFAPPKVSSGTESDGSASSAARAYSALPEISYYAQLDYNAFRQVIDILGGVPVSIDEPMHYDDNWGKLHIHFDPGRYVLNGQKALEYVRYRGHSGDMGRVVRQQQFLLKVFERFKNPMNLLKIPRILLVSIPSVKTNLNLLEKFLVLWELKDIGRDQIRLMQLPGHSQNGLWIPDPDGIAATAGLLSGKRDAGAKSNAEPREGSENAAPSAPVPPALRSTTVEVWNASSKKGLAIDVVRQLRGAGFDVVKWGNYASRQSRTIVKDHKGNMEQARAIAAALTAPKVEVFTHMESKPLVDVEVILGEDYVPVPEHGKK